MVTSRNLKPIQQWVFPVEINSIKLGYLGLENDKVMEYAPGFIRFMDEMPSTTESFGVSMDI